MTIQEVLQMFSESKLESEIRFEDDSAFIYFGLGFSRKGDAKRNLTKSLSDASDLLNCYIDKLNGRSSYSAYVCGYNRGYEDRSKNKSNEFGKEWLEG